MVKGFWFRSVRSLLVILAACGVAVSLYATREKPEKREIVESVPVVEVIRVHPESQVMSVETYGTVVPRRSMKLTAEVPGRVTWLNPDFREGARVADGEILVRIDPRSYVLEAESAKVMIVQAKADIQRLVTDVANLQADRLLAVANADLSARELARQQTLSNKDFTSQTRLDQAMQRDIEARSRLQSIENSLGLTDAVMKQKQAALDMAGLALEKAQLALDRTEIKAGFNGLILLKSVEQGEFVGVGQPLGSLYLEGALDIDASVPLEKMAWIEPMLAEGKQPVAQVSLATGTGGPGWKARVARVKAAVDERTRTLPLALEMAPSSGEGGVNGLPKPGTFVLCTIQGPILDTVVVLPRYLIRTDNSVYVVTDGKLASRSVTVMRRFQESVYISAGLEDGDLVISTPLPKAVNGMAVMVRNTVAKAGQE